MPDGASPTEHRCDLLIVGAGPAGLYAAYYAGFRGLSCVIMDSLSEPGGQLSALYPTKLIYDVAGFPAIRGQDLVDNLVEQAAPFHPTYVLDERAEELHDLGDELAVIGHKGTMTWCRAVIITGGMGTFSPRTLPCADGFEGKGLMYFVPNLKALAGLDVLIVGGGDSAFDWALNLEPIARSVTLVHRRDRFRAHAHTVEQVLASSARVMTFTEVGTLIGDEHIEAAELCDNRTDERTSLEVQAVVAAVGFTADLGPLKRWGVDVRNRAVVVDTTMATSLPRVFAAGDIADYPGKVRLISVGFGEAALAVNNAATVIDPRATLFPGHSSNVP